MHNLDRESVQTRTHTHQRANTKWTNFHRHATTDRFTYKFIIPLGCLLWLWLKMKLSNTFQFALWDLHQRLKRRTCNWLQISFSAIFQTVERNQCKWAHISRCHRFWLQISMLSVLFFASLLCVCVCVFSNLLYNIIRTKVREFVTICKMRGKLNSIE